MADSGSGVALSRIVKLLDPNSFVQIGESMTARATDFNADTRKAENDGVITGHGLVDGNLVFVYCQDSATLGGTLGEMHARKICALYDMATKVGAPVVGMLDTKGIRIMESVDAAEALASVCAKMAKASGVVPMISAVFGELGGGMATLASLADFTFMESKSKLFVTPPDAIEGVNKDNFDPSSASNQYHKTGIVDAVGSEDEILSGIRELIALIPGSSLEEGRVEAPVDDMNRLLDLSFKNSDTKTFVSALADQGRVFAAKEGYAPGILTAIIRLGGRTVGIVANNTKDGKPGKVCNKCTGKAARFIRFLDAFEIPVLTITDVGGYNATLESEAGLPLSLAELTLSLANASSAKINLIRSGVSTAYLFMNSKSLSADLVYAYEDSKLELLEAGYMAKVIAEESNGSADEIEAKLKDEIFGAKNAARRGYVDSLITFQDTRKYLIAGFDMLFTKTTAPYKKHEAR